MRDKWQHAPRVLLLTTAVAAGLACEEPRPTPLAPAHEDAILVRVATVGLDDHNSPVVILEEQDGPRILPIWIGTAEATSIAMQINRQTLPRPNSHDLTQRVIDQLEAEVERLVVTELRHGTYYAVLVLRARGRSIEIDVRPSDGIAVALRTGSPILVNEELLEKTETLETEDPGRPIRWTPPERRSRTAGRWTGRQPATSTLEL